MTTRAARPGPNGKDDGQRAAKKPKTRAREPDSVRRFRAALNAGTAARIAATICPGAVPDTAQNDTAVPDEQSVLHLQFRVPRMTCGVCAHNTERLTASIDQYTDWVSVHCDGTTCTGQFTQCDPGLTMHELDQDEKGGADGQQEVPIPTTDEVHAIVKDALANGLTVSSAYQAVTRVVARLNETIAEHRCSGRGGTSRFARAIVDECGQPRLLITTTPGLKNWLSDLSMVTFDWSEYRAAKHYGQSAGLHLDPVLFWRSKPQPLATLWRAHPSRRIRDDQ